MQRSTDANTQPVASTAADTTPVLSTGPLAIVGGCGHVGLPLGLAFARKGYQVDLFDTSAERVAQVTDRLARQLEQMGRGDVDLAYCPERIVQGKSLVELEQLPQLVAGTTPQAAERAAALFRVITKKVIFLRPVEAELAKLFCNAWRYLNFAVSNQFYVMARHFDADFYRIYQALREDYPRMASFARPGFAAGPCLLKDTMQLGSFNHGSFVLGQAAMMVNEGLPYQVVQDIKRAYPLSYMTVGILGMAFKPNSDDARSSLSYKLRKV